MWILAPKVTYVQPSQAEESVGGMEIEEPVVDDKEDQAAPTTP